MAIISPHSRFHQGLRLSLLITMLAGLTLSLAVAPITHAATLVITTTNDEFNGDGDCSLREAIQAANTGTAVDACIVNDSTHTITLPAGTYSLAIANQVDGENQGIDEDGNVRGDLDIRGSLTIIGAGPATIIDGRNIDRIFEVLTDASVAISELTLQNGHASSAGGAISNSGTLTLDSVIVTRNLAASGFNNNDGGGIYNDGALTIRNSVISGNRASSGEGNYGEGGGIRNDGQVSISNTTISENMASDDDDAGRGGGIYNTSVASLENVRLRNNGGGPGGWGGGIANSGGTLTISQSAVSSNYAGDGAGIANVGGTLVIDSTLISENSGVGVFNDGVVSIDEATISHNSGSGFVNRMTRTAELSNTQILNNAGDYGGGVNNAGTLTIVGSLIAGNVANGLDEPGGGGINNGAGGTLTLNTSSIRNNVAEYGGAIANFGALFVNTSSLTHNEAKFGGAIFSRGSALTIDGGFLRDNDVTAGGGGVYSENDLTIRNSTVAENTANAEGGGLLFATTGTASLVNNTFSANRSAASGGAIHNTTSGTLNLNNLTIANNTGNSDGDMFGSGGGISNPFGTVNIKNSIVAGNTDAGSASAGTDCSGTLTSQGYNLVQSWLDCSIEGNTTGNIIRETPSLGPLQDNGGATPTHALLLESPAIDRGSPARPNGEGDACALFDQRGVARPQDSDRDLVARCDIGAYELRLEVQVTHLPLVFK